MSEPPHGEQQANRPCPPGAGRDNAVPQTGPPESAGGDSAPPIAATDIATHVGLRVARLVTVAQHILARVETDMPTPDPMLVHELNIVVDCLSERDILAVSREGVDLARLLAYRRDRERWLAVRAATDMTVGSRRFNAMPLHQRLKVLDRQKLEADARSGEREVLLALGLKPLR